ncbi:16470_t:CDS:2 [Rhizophagus irregularis]|nr:16470_t:CDS:2 [Rhizophagus irregularis]
MEQTWLEKAIRKKHINFHKYGDFENIEIIGSGAYGRVSKAEWVNRDMCIAIKSIKVFSNADEDIWKNFIKEVIFVSNSTSLKNQRKVDYHKNIIRFYGISKDVSEKLKKMNLNHKSQLPSQSFCLTPSISSDKITSSSSSYINDFSSKEDNEKIIISEEDEKFLNILVTIFVNSINNGDEYYQTAISLFCFIEENNKDPTDI